ncbi:fatty-acid synthase system [Sarracenia purpurea var. burkii]
MFAASRQLSDMRYLFVMDNEIPCQTALESQQIQDLPVSVLQDGEWGSYQYLSESSSESKENPNSLDYVPGDIQLESVHLQYLSCDKQVEVHDQMCNYGIEYSGVQDTGERVMGLSLIDSNDPISKPDPFLKWKVPKDWTLEEAATVPFTYAQAYHILDAPVILDKNQVDSVLINIGDDELFCEACIAISLSRNYIIYVSVANAEEAASIKNKFPQRIEDLQDCLNCVSPFGSSLQFGTPGGWENHELENEKENLRAVVEDGIRTGVVKPFDRTVQIQGMSANAETDE